jgi:hypothetical protein
MRLAQIENPFKNITIPTRELGGVININKEDLKLGEVVSGLLPYLFAGAGLLLLLYLLLGGFQLMTSAGDPKKMQEAKGKLTNAFVGFIIIFIAYWLVQIVGTILGIEAITNIFR